MSAWPSPIRSAATILVTAILLSVVAAEGPPRRVLLVYQDDGIYPSYVVFEQSLARTLREQLGANLDFYREHLEWGRFPNDRERAIEYLRSRFVDRHIEIVIFVGNVPSIILPSVPTLYVGNHSSEMLQAEATQHKVVALWLQADAVKSLVVARRLQPNARKVVVIGGSAPGDLVWFNEFRTQLKPLESQLDIEYVTEASVQELLEKVSHLPRDTIVLPIVYSRDRAGNNYVPRDVNAMLAKASSAPVYGLSDTFMGSGTVGGYLISWEKVGEAAANLALDVLHGKSPADVIAPSSGTGRYAVDWRQLQRWGFSEKDLPPNTQILYRVPTVWEQYRWRIVGIVALLALQTLLIIKLLMQKKELQASAERLFAMAGRLVDSQEDERRRIAREIHDDFSQRLALVSVKLGNFAGLDRAAAPSELDAGLEDVRESIVAVAGDLRDLSHQLHPATLGLLGFVGALRALCEEFQRARGIDTEFDVSVSDQDASEQAAMCLYRVLQESLMNVAKHSGSASVQVSLTRQTDPLEMRVRDQGQGFDPETKGGQGIGLTNIEERVRLLNGKLVVKSQPGSDTEIVVTIPAVPHALQQTA